MFFGLRSAGNLSLVINYYEALRFTGVPKFINQFSNHPTVIVALIYPHQLFDRHPALIGADLCLLIEEPLLFKKYSFHIQKLALHRATMKFFEAELSKKNIRIEYVEADQISVTGEIVTRLQSLGVTKVQFVDPCDDWLDRRLTRALNQVGLEFVKLEDPNFLTPISVIDSFAAERDQKWFFTEFYIEQRKRLKILLDEKKKPLGGKWSFDKDNRKKLPSGTLVPDIAWPKQGKTTVEAIRHVKRQFPNAPGDSASFGYSTTRQEARKSLQDFLQNRFENFGLYEDAIDSKHTFLFHSVLTPSLNIGLISPQEVIEAVMEYADRVPISSLEGFIRQVIGWREFIRAVYLKMGSRERTRNYWEHQFPMPKSFYDGSTGIDPVDTVIRRVNQHAYCHHIERLMVLGNFMLLCEISADACYQWFMELFIDAYDWVMVPNVYGMSQYADGGMITTKPYISGSAYILKMSNFEKGPWCSVWDALYWRFIDKHRDFFSSNPRMSMMVKLCDRLGPKMLEHHRTAENFLDRIHG